MRYAGFEGVRTEAGIHEYRLRTNNLTVLLMEDHSAPVVTFMVTYRVGSRNEAAGYTGATHLLEHLMFKGSRNFNRERGNSIWEILQSLGAVINATTWLDRTNYFELIPADHLERAVEIEADRMRGLLLRDEDRQPEMVVVRNEFERGENDPFEVLDKNVWATAYQAHPYHHATIGWRSDIENVPTKRLKEFYDTFYWPNNATVTLIGDFHPAKALGMIRKYFGPIPPSPGEIPQVYTREPKQEGPRRVVVRRTGETPVVGVAHKSPEGLHPDTYPLQVLAKILASGKTSRFYRTLVHSGLVTDLFVWCQPLRDNGLFITYAFVAPGVDPQKVENVIIRGYNGVKARGVSDEEVRRAKGRIRAETAFSRDGSYSVASNLNEAIGIGDWTFYASYLERIEGVTARDVQRVARTYLDEDQRTTGLFLPVSRARKGRPTSGIESNGPPARRGA
ncbi:MAG: M16 family metallopeptidase [Fidelibacterota bacterium]